MKRTLLSCLLCFCLVLGLLAGCGQQPGETADTEPAQEPTAEDTSADAAEQPAGPADVTPDAVITFSETGAVYEGTGVEIDDDGEVDIQSGGVYRVTGTSSSGRIVAEVGETESVTLILAGCDLSWADDEVIYIKQAGSAAVVLEDGTENILTSGTPISADETPADETIADETASDETSADETIADEAASGETAADETAADEEDASGAALRSKTSLNISGTGALTVYGYINNGIAAVGDLTVDGGVIAITSVNDALKSRGVLTLSGGDITIDSEADGVQADLGISIAGGEMNIVTGGGSANAPETSGEMGFGQSPWDADDSSSVSQKGLKSEGNIILSGGKITLDTVDDSVHVAGNFESTGGELEAASGDDGVHSDQELKISGGSIVVTKSYEGLEAKAITIADGFVEVTASDDGMNVNGGDFGFFGRSASDEADTAEEEDDLDPVLRITGGTVYVHANGDGLDSNGDLCLEGGVIVVSGPSANMDAPLDHGDGNGYVFYITGGEIIAAGSSGMADSPELTDNSQPTIQHVRDGSCVAGDTVTLKDSEGNVILTAEITTSSFNCVYLSSPKMVVGETYTLTMGDYETQITLDSTIVSNRGGGFGMGGRRSSDEPGSRDEAPASSEANAE